MHTASSRAERIHALVAAARRTHVDPEGRDALRAALVELESLVERLRREEER